MKFDQIIHIILAIGLITMWFLASSRKNWKEETNRLVNSLTGFTMDGSEILFPNRAMQSKIKDENTVQKDFSLLIPFPPLEEFLWEDEGLQYLPNCVQRYLHRSLLFTGERERNWEEKIQIVRTVEIDQGGTALIHGKWEPLVAKMHYSASFSHPGFLWDAKITMPMPFFLAFFKDSYDVYVRNAHVNGVHSLKVEVMGIVPSNNIFGLTHPPDKEEQTGIILKWLAGTPFFPTSLLPHAESGVHWNTYHERDYLSTLPELEHTSKWVSATATFTDPVSGDKGEVEFQFDDNGMISSVYAKRLRSKRGINASPKDVITLWECRYRDYQLMGHGMLIPTRISAGWWEENGFQPHLHMHNVGFHFTYF